jgi:hypothetical protein
MTDKDSIAKIIHDDWTVAGIPWDKMMESEKLVWLDTASKVVEYLKSEKYGKFIHTGKMKIVDYGHDCEEESIFKEIC